MKNKTVTLYDIKKENGDWFSLTARLDQRSSTLFLEGQDFSKLAEDMFGDEEHEYFYVFGKESIEKLKRIFNKKDVLAALGDYFHGEMLNTEFLNLCKDNGISYELHVI